MTSVHFPSYYPIWPLWDSIAWERRIPFSSEQEVLLFAAVTIRHRDRKQILIIIWTHRGKKKKITYGSQQNESVLQNCETRWLFVSTSRSQECCSSYDSRWGWGGEWHHRLCSHLNSDTVAPCVPIQTPPHLPAISSLKPGLCLALPFLSPLKEYLLFSSSS